MLAFVDQHFAIDQSPTDTDRFFDEAFLIAGQVLHHFRITFADRRWLEDTANTTPLTKLRPDRNVIPQFCKNLGPRRVMQAHMCPNFEMEKPPFQPPVCMLNQISDRPPIEVKQIGNKRFFKKLSRYIHATLRACRKSALLSLRQQGR